VKTFVLNGWASSQEAWNLCLFERERIFTCTELLDGVAEDVLEKEKEFVLVGWSMGGSFALRYAMKFPEKLKGLILVAATPRMMRDNNWEGMTPRRLAALEAGLKMTKGQGFFGTPEGRPNPYKMDSDENLARGLEYLKSTDLRLDLIDLLASGKVRCPVYIFQSEADGIVRSSNAKFLSSVFPHAELEMISGGEHALPVAIPEKIDVAVASCVL
jgi:pimeloyl-[acyl-carrier protein] methyl ester esterase